MTDTQETIEVTPEIQVVMTELALPLKSIGIGLTNGYEARLINPDAPAVVGNVIWAKLSHIDAFQAYMDHEVLGAFEDAKRAVTLAASLVHPDELPFDLPLKQLYTQAQLNDAILQVGLEKRGLDRRSIESKGWEAYGKRQDGCAWAELGPNALNNAKAYAKARGLPWPIVIDAGEG